MTFTPGQNVEFVEDTGEVLVTSVVYDTGDHVHLKGRHGIFVALRERVFELGDDKGLTSCLEALRKKFTDRIDAIDNQLFSINEGVWWTDPDDS